MAARLGAMLLMALAADALEVDSNLDSKILAEAQQEMARVEATWEVQINDFKNHQMNLVSKEAETEQQYLRAKLERAHAETSEAKAEQERATNARKEAETIFEEKKLRADAAVAFAGALERKAKAAAAVKAAHVEAQAAINKRDKITQERIQAQKNFEAKRTTAMKLIAEADNAEATAPAAPVEPLLPLSLSEIDKTAKKIDEELESMKLKATGAASAALVESTTETRAATESEIDMAGKMVDELDMLGNLEGEVEEMAQSESDMESMAQEEGIDLDDDLDDDDDDDEE